jgi:hypothetical protein
VAPLAYRVPIYALTTSTLWCFNFWWWKSLQLALLTLASNTSSSSLVRTYVWYYQICTLHPHLRNPCSSPSQFTFFFPRRVCILWRIWIQSSEAWRAFECGQGRQTHAGIRTCDGHSEQERWRRDDGDVVIPETSSSEDGKPVVHSVENVWKSVWSVDWYITQWGQILPKLCAVCHKYRSRGPSPLSTQPRPSSGFMKCAECNEC